jgi:predicted ATP-dependent endonuclease of OLD family
MRIDNVYIEDFKNLKKFNINFHPSDEIVETVLLGQNASGKSNFIEALVLIFKYLDLKKPPKKKDYFEYKIDYRIYHKEEEYKIHIELKNKKYIIKIANQDISNSNFFNNRDKFLPRNVFTYYSGVSNRLYDHFKDHQKNFYDKIIKPNTKLEDVDELRRLFYVQMIHSFFVLMAFYSFPEDEENTKNFLKDVLKIEDLESILFVLQKPNWKGKGDERFWGADGVVQDLLKQLWDSAIAPIYTKEKVDITFRNKSDKEKLYLYVSNKEKLRELASLYKDNTYFFKALESLYISDLVEEVHVKVKKIGVDGKITFKELSEGEQQLLTVLGNLRFTKDSESLVLLDEPDTHLNPLWKWRYLEYLRSVVNTPKSTQIIFNTHDPLVIGGLEKEQVRIFRTLPDGTTEVFEPDESPKGMGVAGILTSELFGLPTILDRESYKKLIRKRVLHGKIMRDEINQDEINEFEQLSKELDDKGFNDTSNDAIYDLYIQEVSKFELFQKVDLTEDEKTEMRKISKKILENILEEQNPE